MKWVIRTVTLLWTILLTKGADTTVTCLFSKECVLPCQSKYSDIIHWHKIEQNEIIVHSYYDKADQLAYQDAKYKGRTSMFPKQIPTGNASLLLREVNVQDGGKYKCYTASTDSAEEKYITLNVKAPIKSVEIMISDNEIICNAKEVYPQPQISWYIDGAVQKPNTEMKQDKSLFSLTSTLSLSAQKNQMYSCTVTSGDETYTARLKVEETEISAGDELSIPCPGSRGETGDYQLRLTFDESSTVLTYDSRTKQKNETQEWKGLNPQVTDEGNIKLSKLDRDGIYTCQRITKQSNQLFMTTVQIDTAGKTMIVAIVVTIVICFAACFVVLIIKKKRCNTKPTENGQTTTRVQESAPLQQK